MPILLSIISMPPIQLALGMLECILNNHIPLLDVGLQLEGTTVRTHYDEEPREGKLG